MSYTFYICLHLIGLISLFYALGGVALHLKNGGTRDFKHRRLIMITHGVSLVVVFVSAFGLLARINITWPWPLWVWAKLALWLSLGGIVRLFFKKPQLAGILYFVVLTLGALAVLLVELKP